jgi:hypothetical protein
VFSFANFERIALITATTGLGAYLLAQAFSTVADPILKNSRVKEAIKTGNPDMVRTVMYADREY